MFQHMTDFSWQGCRAALALPLLVLFAAPAAFAQSESGASTARRMELEKRITDIANMFQSDPRYNRGKTPEQIRDGVEFVTGNVLFVLARADGSRADQCPRNSGGRAGERTQPTTACDGYGSQDGGFLRRPCGGQHREGMVHRRPARQESGCPDRILRRTRHGFAAGLPHCLPAGGRSARQIQRSCQRSEASEGTSAYVPVRLEQCVVVLGTVAQAPPAQTR